MDEAINLVNLRTRKVGNDLMIEGWIEWMNDWMNEWMNEWMNDWLIEWVEHFRSSRQCREWKNRGNEGKAENTVSLVTKEKIGGFSLKVEKNSQQNKPGSNSVTLFPSYFITLLPCYPVTLVSWYHGTLSPCYPVTLSPCLPVSLIPYYPNFSTCLQA